MDLSTLVSRTLSRRRHRQEPLRIVQAGHPALRARAREAEGQLEEDLMADLVEAMTVTMREAPGVGLAAPQIGIPLRLVVLEDPYADPDGGQDESDQVLRRTPLGLHTFLDPVYEPVGERTAFYWEGCLSVDGWQSIVPRHLEVRARATRRREDGTLVPFDEQWIGWPARIFQHEADHLDGTLCHDVSVPRSMVAARYTEAYADLPDAVRRLHLTGDVTRLRSGEVELG